MVKLWAVYKKLMKHSHKSDDYYNVTCYKALSHDQQLIISMQTSSGGFGGRDRKSYSFSQIFSFSKQVQKRFSDSFDTLLLIMLMKSAQKDQSSSVSNYKWSFTWNSTNLHPAWKCFVHFNKTVFIKTNLYVMIKLSYVCNIYAMWCLRYFFLPTQSTSPNTLAVNSTSQ